MSFAEIVLRLGVTFVAWLVVYMHLIMLLVVRYALCPDTNAWRVSLVSAAFALAAAFALNFASAVRGAGPAFRYFALPLVALLPWAAWICLPYLLQTTPGTANLCAVLTGSDDGTDIDSWQRAWAPVQIVLLFVLGVSAWRAWADEPQDLA